MSKSAIDPVTVFTELAPIAPVVRALTLFKSDAAMEPESPTTTTSLPRPIMVPASFASYAALISDNAPVIIVVAGSTVTATVVLLFKAFKAAASSEAVFTVIVKALPEPVSVFRSAIPF